MSSSFLKTSSPYSSSYGHYGAGTVNPYASYFGPAQSSSPSHPSSATSPVSSPFGGSSLAAGPGGGFSMMNQATSPISSPYGYSAFNSPGRPGGISGGSPSYLVPQPTQTKIIGGVNTSGFVGGSSHLGRTTTGTSPTAPSMYGSAFSSPLTGHDSGHHHEPMHYSPSGSSPPHGPNSVYLPCYFLGLDQHQPHHHYGGSPPSPGGGGGNFNVSGSRAMGSGSFMSPPKNLIRRTVLFEPKSFPENQGVEEVRPPVVKPKGPPIHGFGSSESASAKDFLEAVMISDSSAANPKDDEATGSSPMFPNMKRPQQLAQTSSTSSSPKCWVTVFGFPGGASSFIVTNFSTLGKIVEVKCTPGSNWLHIRFSSPIEARRALSKNGKVLGQSIMVGVIPSDSKVIEDAENANISGDTVSAAGGTTTTPSKSPSSTIPILRERNNVGSSTSGDCLKSRIRPLATGSLPQSSGSVTSPPKSIPDYSSIVRESFQVTRNSDGRPVPVASTGILTKAMEYMFGW